MSDLFSPPSPHGAGRRIGFVLTVALLVSALAAGCHRPPPKKMNKTIEVIVTTPIADEVTDYEDFTGRMEGVKTVDIRPRVSGYMQDATFVEGDVVKEGDLLYQIDPRTYQADFNQAEANLKQAKAEQRLQDERVAHARQLIRSSSIGVEEYEQTVALRDKAVATVGSMEAARARAKLFLDFTRITVPPLHDDEGHPLIGRVSRNMVDPGNLVNADQTILTTIVSVDPMYAYFDVDERTYLDLAAITAPGANSWFSALSFPVLMRLANEDDFTRKGKVNFLDNRLNANTGTVSMRGVFVNPSGVLKSGLFVRIRLPLGVPYKALLIPDEALLSDQGRKYVFIVKKTEDDKGEEVDKVEYRSVRPGQLIQGLRVVKEGVKSGERVIVSGMQRVRPGAVVVAKMREPPKAPESSLTRMLADDRSAIDSPKQPPVAPSLKDMPRHRSHGSRRQGKGRH